MMEKKASDNTGIYMNPSKTNKIKLTKHSKTLVMDKEGTINCWQKCLIYFRGILCSFSNNGMHQNQYMPICIAFCYVSFCQL